AGGSCDDVIGHRRMTARHSSSSEQRFSRRERFLTLAMLRPLAIKRRERANLNGKYAGPALRAQFFCATRRRMIHPVLYDCITSTSVGYSASWAHDLIAGERSTSVSQHWRRAGHAEIARERRPHAQR